MFVFTIKQIREKQGMTLEELSEKAKISTTYLEYLENNKKQNPSLDFLDRISCALNINIKKLFYNDSEIEDIRKQLHRCINRYGLNHPKTLNFSRLMDIFMNAKND